MASASAAKTRTEMEQEQCERACLQHLQPLGHFSPREQSALQEAGVFNEEGEIRLLRERHAAYVSKGLKYLGPGFICLDASRPWLCYWMLHSLDLLQGVQPRAGNEELLRGVVATLESLQNPTGGFGGGYQQLSHCAPTYAAVLALMVVGTEDAYRAIDRKALYRWFMAMKHPSGGFSMHEDGEVDVRGTYTVVSVASILNLLTPELAAGVAEYLLSCQTYEGGFGGEPGHEAHGGYVFCAFAALVLLGRARDADLDALEEWLAGRQMAAEGGFQGRTNKLVDGCYGFWQGGTGALLALVRAGREAEAVGWVADGARAGRKRRAGAGAGAGGGGEEGGDGMEHAADAAEVEYDPAVAVQPSDDAVGTLGAVNQHQLQRYLLHCCQQESGGLRDKPGKPRDFYHTCYVLSGLAAAQHGIPPAAPRSAGAGAGAAAVEQAAQADEDGPSPVVYGDFENLLPRLNPVYNLVEEKAARALDWFYDEGEGAGPSLPMTHAALMDE